MLYEIKDQFGYLVGVATTKETAIGMAKRILDNKIVEGRSIHVFYDGLELYSVKISKIEDDFKNLKEKLKTWSMAKNLVNSIKF
mgnify:CR=1 FL=1